MSDFIQFPTPPKLPELYLAGIRLDPSAEGPQAFVLLEHDDRGHRPITAKGRILFFSHPNAAPRALELANSALDPDATSGGSSLDVTSALMPKTVNVLCDVAESLFLVNSQTNDSEGILLDCIACLDDLVRATRLNVPASYMAALNALGERLEENSEFGTFLEEQGIDRETVEDALLWCVGAIAVRSTWVG